MKANNKKIKILYIVTNSDLGGISKLLLETIKYLLDYVEPYYIMSTPGYFSEELEKLGIKKEHIYFVPMTNNIFDIKQHISSIIGTLKIIKEIKPDLIHCHATTASMVSAVCTRITGIPVLYSVNGWPFTDGITKWKQVFYKIFDILICSSFKKINTESIYDKNQGITLMPWLKDRISAIPNGISDIPDEYKKGYIIPSHLREMEGVLSEQSNLRNSSERLNELKIVMVSRFCPQKDPYTLIQAVGELNEEGYNVKLDLYGYGAELEQVLTEIKKYNTKNIKYCGLITDAIPILKNYDIYSLISNWEGQPVAIIEALAVGLPVIISNICGNSELIQNNGYLIPRKDLQTLKNKIKFYFNNREKLVEEGLNSRKLYEHEFEASVMSKRFFKLYEDILND